MNLSQRLMSGLFVFFTITCLTAPCIAESIVADHNASEKFGEIPSDWFSTVRENWNIYYGHTSHGSQIVTGMDMLEQENSELYAFPTLIEDDPDLGYPDEWESKTRSHLDAHPETNLVMWSWCGQLSWYSESEVDQYLNTMAGLETDYPNVQFVYMTGHLDGEGTSATLYQNNTRIRSFCSENNKVLFDFADIESYDPDGNYYPNESDWCNWCTTWCEKNTCPSCDDCAHSQCFNCYRKGKAFWWMLARLSGWNSSLCNDLSYQSTYDNIQWGCRGSDTLYCIDLCDENWNVYPGLRAIACGENLYSWSLKQVLNEYGISDEGLMGFIFNWRVWSPGGYGGDGFEGQVVIGE